MAVLQLLSVVRQALQVSPRRRRLLLCLERPRRVTLENAAVVGWGGPARLRYHGVLPLEPGHHALMGDHRINLTFRRAL